MNDPSNKQNHGTISEEDVSVILQRYTATAVLGLLQEVAQVQDAKIDWNLLAKRTTTGITNAREYQMLWRHLAYRDEFMEKVEDGVKPLDDDSDLEFELEAFPPVSTDASTEASACVKVLIASGSTSNSGLEKGLTIEAPLTINIPNSKSIGNSSENPQFAGNPRGTNITVPVSVQKQPLPVVATSTEVLDTNGSGSGNLPPRRKRKPWTTAEDLELFAAVQKCGEGNWATILKADFKGDRTASQLSQRWNIIKKRKSNSNAKVSQVSEVHLAARRAINMALDQPGVDSLKASSIGRTKSNIVAITNTSMRPLVSDIPSTTTLPHKQASEDTSALTVTTKTFSKNLPKTSPKSLINGPDPVKAAAVAAGARIVTQSAAATSMLNQHHVKSGMHIKKGVTNFRELHQPNISRPLDRNPNIGVGPVAPSNAPSTATQEAKGTSIFSSSNLPQKVQQDEAAAISAKVKAVQDTSEKQVKEDVAFPIVQTEIKKSVQNEGAKHDQ